MPAKAEIQSCRHSRERGCVKTPGRERIYPRDQNESAVAMWIAPRFDATLSENGVAFPPRRGSREFSHSLESGNPGFKCLARLARDLKSYLWVADPRQVTFLCLSKEKSPKERTPRMARLPPAHPRFRDPALPLREIHLALGSRRHPLFAPLPAAQPPR